VAHKHLQYIFTRLAREDSNDSSSKSDEGEENGEVSMFL